MSNIEFLKNAWSKAVKKRGWLYIARNVNNKDILKVGLTQKDPFERAKTLTTAGVLGKYEMLYAVRYIDCFEAEAKIHSLLRPYHIEKELFNADINTVKNIFLDIKHEEKMQYSPLDTAFLLYDLTPERWLNQS